MPTQIDPLKAAALALAGALVAGGGQAEAKAPGATYCFRGYCHRVLTLTETRALVGRDTTLATSYYDSCAVDRFNPCGLTSSGEEFRPDQPDNAASPIYPDGTLLVLLNPTTGRAAAVRVNNAGPYLGRRRLDVSRATARALGFEGQGVTDLVARVVAAPRAADARYQKRRRYAPAPGDLGAAAGLDDAHDRAASVIARRALDTGEADALRLALVTARVPPAAVAMHDAAPLPVAAHGASAPLLGPREAAPLSPLKPPDRETAADPGPQTVVAARAADAVLVASELDESWSTVVAGMTAAAQAKARRGVRPTTTADLPLRTASLALVGVGDLASRLVRYARDAARR